jgi:hypothetical protein
MKALLILPLVLLLSCSEPEYESTIFSIDRGTLLRSGDTVLATGYIGPNGCYRFHHREISETDTSLTLKYFGIHDEPPGSYCTQALAGFTDTLILRPDQRTKSVRW